MMTLRRAPRTFGAPSVVRGARFVVVILALFGAGSALASPAGAHAELTSSDPANASTVSAPVEVVTLTFSKASEPDPDRFTISGPEGAVGVGSVTVDRSGLVITVRPERPLAGGRYRLGWGIRSGDTHRMGGSISFTSSAAAVAPGGSVDTPAASGAPSSGTSADTSPAAPQPPTALPPTALPATNSGSEAPAGSAASTASSVDRVATAVRGAFYLALLGAVGGTAYLSLVHRGPRGETRWLVALVRRAAAVAVALTLVTVPVGAAVADGGWGGVLAPGAWVDALSSGQGIATVLRLVGATMVLLFVGVGLVPVRPAGRTGAAAGPVLAPADPGPVGAQPVAGGGSALLVAPPAPAPVVRRSRRREPVQVAPAPLAWLGAALLVGSESFVGHTADTSPRLLMALDDAVHLGAAGLWSAGVALLAATVWRRRSGAASPPVAPLAARFSWWAAVALVAVAVTGLVMGALILGDPTAVWSTDFGRVLVAKVLLVAVAAGLGAYHRRELLPRLSGPDGADPAALARFRATLAVETVLFVAIVALTAVLVSASPVP